MTLKYIKSFVIGFALIFPELTLASSLVHSWNSPAFSGEGYSQHVLTVDNQELTRTQKIAADIKSEIDRLAREEKNTNINKFIVNFESRVYAKLSQQLADELFSDNGATSGTMDLVGNTLTWIREGDFVRLIISEPDGTQTEITVPVGDFNF